MDISLAKELEKKLQISSDAIVREEYELVLLKAIFESDFSTSLIFKGGTALRLCYGSPRFSDDLDFSVVGVFDSKEFLTFLEHLKGQHGIISVETADKHYTAFALVKFSDSAMSRPFSIKIEASKRAEEWIRGEDYTTKPITSPVTVLSLVGYVASLEHILAGKIDAIKNRKAPRDAFDYWFIKQALGNHTAQLDFSQYDREAVTAEMRRLLPRQQWNLLKNYDQKKT